MMWNKRNKYKIVYKYTRETTAIHKQWTWPTWEQILNNELTKLGSSCSTFFDEYTHQTALFNLKYHKQNIKCAHELWSKEVMMTLDWG